MNQVLGQHTEFKIALAVLQSSKANVWCGQEPVACIPLQSDFWQGLHSPGAFSSTALAAFPLAGKKG